MTEADLAGIVGARICHDLANPVGAIVNGADLIREVGASDATQELAMIEQSAHRAAALITLYRLAFGVPRDHDTALTQGQLRGHIASVLSGPRISLAWDAPESGMIGGAEARLMTLMVLAGRAMLGIAGELAIACPGRSALPASVIASGSKVAVSDRQREWLAGTCAMAPDARQIEFALIPAALKHAEARLELLEETGQITLRAERI